MGLDQYLYARRTIDDEATRQKIVDLCPDAARHEEEGSHYLSRWPFSPEAGRKVTNEVLHLAGLTPLLGEESNHALVALDGSWVQTPATYWRKANSVHAWFVDNCQGGKDECQESIVHCEQLALLVRLCTQALDHYTKGDLNRAGQTMTPQAGFFFGSTEIDGSWAEDMTWTVSEITRIVNAAIAIGGVDFYYSASW